MGYGTVKRSTRAYTFNTTPSRALSAIDLNKIAKGSTVTTRVGDQVKALRIKGRANFELTSSTPDAVYYFRIAIAREYPRKDNFNVGLYDADVTHTLGLSAIDAFSRDYNTKGMTLLFEDYMYIHNINTPINNDKYTYKYHSVSWDISLNTLLNYSDSYHSEISTDGLRLFWWYDKAGNAEDTPSVADAANTLKASVGATLFFGENT